MNALKPFNQITIIGKRWFQKSFGNTYHLVTVYVDGKCLGNSGRHYGYSEQYIQTAHAMLQKEGYYPKTENHNDYGKFIADKMENRDMFVISVSDVSRERDL